MSKNRASKKATEEHRPFPSCKEEAVRWAIAKSALCPICIQTQQALIVLTSLIPSDDDAYQTQAYGMARDLLQDDQGRDTCEMIICLFPGTLLEDAAKRILNDISE